MMTVVSLVLAILAVLVLVYAQRWRSESHGARICRLFGLDPAEFELVGTDLGGSKDKVYLKGDGLAGVPDAVFRHRSTRAILIGEAKSRRFNGAVSRYEEYQVALYMGLARRRYRVPVSALIRYGCGQLVPLELDPDAYSELVRLIPRYRQVAKSLSLA